MGNRWSFTNFPDADRTIQIMENGAAIQKTTPVKAIFFDMDNTLIATRKADKQAINKLMEILWEKYAVPIDFASNACKTYLRAFRKCPENISMSLDSWRLQLWKQALSDQYNKYAGEIYQIWLKLRYDYLALTPDIHNLLQTLHHHYFLALITNGTSSAQWEKIERLNLHQYFDVILVSGDLPWEKPHKRIYHEACNYLGLMPEQCLMVGDKLDVDILGAVRAEIGGTVWVPLQTCTELDDDDPTPDYVVNNVTELLNILPKNFNVSRFRNKALNSHAWRNKMCFDGLEDSNSNSSDGS